MFKLGIGQFTPVKGDDESNLDRIAQGIALAVDSGAEMVVFPESSVTGYILEGGVEQHSCTAAVLAQQLGARLNLEAQVEAFVGFYERADGRPYNSVAHILFDSGSAHIQGVYRKFFPPTYGVFDEARYHGQGTELGIFETRHGRIGVLICEDVWHSMLRTLLALHGCHTILVPSATPARDFRLETPGNLLRYERMLVSCSEENGVYSVLSCLTGSEGGKMLAGGSMVIDPFGEKIAQASALGEEMLIVNIEPDDAARSRLKIPLLQDLRHRWRDLIALAEQVPLA